jgi:hypothetical protein
MPFQAKRSLTKKNLLNRLQLLLRSIGLLAMALHACHWRSTGWPCFPCAERSGPTFQEISGLLVKRWQNNLCPVFFGNSFWFFLVFSVSVFNVFICWRQLSLFAHFGDGSIALVVFSGCVAKKWMGDYLLVIPALALHLWLLMTLLWGLWAMDS